MLNFARQPLPLHRKSKKTCMRWPMQAFNTRGGGGSGVDARWRGVKVKFRPSWGRTAKCPNCAGRRRKYSKTGMGSCREDTIQCFPKFWAQGHSRSLTYDVTIRHYWQNEHYTYRCGQRWGKTGLTLTDDL